MATTTAQASMQQQQQPVPVKPPAPPATPTAAAVVQVGMATQVQAAAPTPPSGDPPAAPEAPPSSSLPTRPPPATFPSHDTVQLSSDSVVEAPVAGACRALVGPGGETLALLTGAEFARVLLRYVPAELSWTLPDGALATTLQRCGAPVPVRASPGGVEPMPCAADGTVRGAGCWGVVTFASSSDAAKAVAAIRSDANPTPATATPLPPVTELPAVDSAAVLPAGDLGETGTPDVECPVCMERIGVGSGFRVRGCGHAFHKACVAEHVAAALEAGKDATSGAFPMTCPDASTDGSPCATRLCLADILGALTPRDSHQRLVHESCAAFVGARAAEWRHCPTPDCRRVFQPAHLRGGPDGSDAAAGVTGAGAGAGAGSPAAGAGSPVAGAGSPAAGGGEAAATKWSCDACSHAYCIACDGEPYHEGLSCEDHKRQKREAVLQGQFDEWATKDWIPANDTMLCPNAGCGVWLERMSGCNSVTCLYCSTAFTWKQR